MSVRAFALAIGLVFLCVGILGFIPRLVETPPFGAPELAVKHNHGYLFGLFPVNTLHNIVHLIVGVAGLFCYRSFSAARGFSRSLAVFYGLLAVMGLFPYLKTTFGLIPIHGNDVWLHAVTAALAGYFGFIAHRRPTRDDLEPHERPGGYRQPM